MAQRLKTIEYAVQSDPATLATGNDRTKTLTVHIPESGVVFKSCAVLMSVRGGNPAAGNMTSPVLGFKLGAAAELAQTLPNPSAGSGEHESWEYAADVTPHFVANWSGTSMVATFRCRFTGVVTANHDFKLVVTYEYDDTSARHAKTVRVPIGSTRSLLTTAYQTIGGATAIPALTAAVDPWLPEDNVTIRRAVLELWGNEATTAATDYTMSVRVGGSGGLEFPACYFAESALVSGTWATVILDCTSVDFSTAKSVEALASLANRFDNLGGVLTVTYEFDEDSPRVLNSLLVGAVDTVGHMGGTAAGDQDKWARSLYIQEPGPIEMKESCAALFLGDIAAVSARVAVGTQTDVTYTVTAPSLTCGQYSLVHAFGPNAPAGGAGMTLDRGRNEYAIEFRSATSQAGWNLSGFLVLNYESDRHPDGPGAHARSIRTHVGDNLTNYTVVWTADAAPVIPASFWWLMSAVAWSAGTIQSPSTLAVALLAERQAGEAEGDGWESLYVGFGRSDAENQVFTVWGAARRVWKRWTGDPDPDRLDPQVAGRRFRRDSGRVACSSMAMWWTYHAISFEFPVTVEGYSGDGSGITVDLFRADTNEHVASAVTGVGGSVTFPWGDDTEELYAVAEVDGVGAGRTPNALAA